MNANHDSTVGVDDRTIPQMPSMARRLFVVFWILLLCAFFAMFGFAIAGVYCGPITD